MTNQSWTGIQPPSDDEMDELRSELSATIDDHDQAHKKATGFHHRKLHRKTRAQR